MLPQYNIFWSQQADLYNAALEAKQFATFPEKRKKSVFSRSETGLDVLLILLFNSGSSSTQSQFAIFNIFFKP
jgi:hypothetical protein